MKIEKSICKNLNQLKKHFGDNFTLKKQKKEEKKIIDYIPHTYYWKFFVDFCSTDIVKRIDGVNKYMIDVEDRIFDYILENGLSSSSVKLIKENLPNISSSFLTDILVENINIHLQYKLLIEFLPDIWKDENTSSNLLAYISGVLHRLIYLAREQPLGKEISSFYREELELFHQQLCDFRLECLDSVESFEQQQLGKVESFAELILAIESLPKLSAEITEMLRIVSLLFLQFATNRKQNLRNLDELSLFLSRCLVLWKLKTLTDTEFNECLKKAIEKFSGSIDLDKFEEILSLEIQNYQFLQFGISHRTVKLIADTFKKIHDTHY